ncbi:hypothetical protein F2Q68_00043456 [Brassica cretica]|uniref:Malectin-like domain-containing protein n=1 Tax=Brassica cretica TaxID=69181 RepID=A0A8S9LQT5_BRACR|nr:hypothetical protein F2Q68_00043456 [Brassica cretica]
MGADDSGPRIRDSKVEVGADGLRTQTADWCSPRISTREVIVGVDWPRTTTADRACLRSFPDGQRNCYNFNLTRNQRYLIRGTFLYGNYDGLNLLPSFDLHIGQTKWTSVSIRELGSSLIREIIHVLTEDSLQICLVKTGETTPFISSLELRPLNNNNTYVSQSGSLMLLNRVYFSPTPSFIRYDEDIHDRIWVPFIKDNTTSISTDLPVDTSNPYNVPQLVARKPL